MGSFPSLTLAILLASCHLGETALMPSVATAYDPATDNYVVSASATFAPPLRHDRDQWQQAFGQRNEDVATIARMTAEAAQAQEALAAARTEVVAVQGNLAALTADRDRWREEAEEDWFLRAWDSLLKADLTWPVAVVAVCLLGVVVLVRRRRRKGRKRK